MDDLDRQILAALRADAATPAAALARRLGVARSTIQSRIERMKARGVIAGFTVRLGDSARARIRATVLLAVEPHAQPGVLSRLKAMPAVETAHTTSGRFDLIVAVGAETTGALDAVLDRIGEAPGVRSSESLIHLSTKIDRG